MQLYGNQYANLPQYGLKLKSEFGTIENNYAELDPVTQDIYNRYKFNLPLRTDLPISSKREHILSDIERSPVIIVTGHTGCGMFELTRIHQNISKQILLFRKNHPSTPVHSGGLRCKGKLLQYYCDTTSPHCCNDDRCSCSI